jgi:TPR repeat protein
MKTGLLVLLLVAGAAGIGAVPLASDIPALQAKAQAGDADAEFQLAEAYRGGRGVPADPETAIMWYRRAAGQGHIRASEELGFALFAHGDRREAMPYIEKAAARGEARALYLLGTAHFNGDYATRDWPLAYAQTMRAASAGLSAAQRNLDLMDHYLLPSDKAKAEQILATLPPVRTKAQAQEAASGATPIAASTQISAATSAPKVVKPVVAVKIPKPAPVAPVPAPDGVWKVQLGAFGSADRAQERWKTLTAKVSGLGRYDRRLAAAGSVQRLQAGGIASKADAQALCTKVRAAGGDCLVLAP